MVINNLFNTNLAPMGIHLNFIEFMSYGFVLFSVGLGIISIGTLILLSANAAEEVLKKAGKIITGIGVGGSVYTGGKEVYKDLKGLGDNSNNSGNTSKGSTSSTDKTSKK